MREETQLISFFEISFFLPNKTILHAKFQTHRSENIGTGHTIDGHLDRQSFFNIRIVISNKNVVWNNVISLRINRAAKGAGWQFFW